MSKTVTKLFDTYEEATDAVGDLEASGIPHSDISIVASNADRQHQDVKDNTGAATGATAGAVIGGGAGLLAGLGLIAIPGLGPVIAAGWLVAAAAGAAVGGGAGGIIGSLTDHGVPPEHAHIYAEGIRRGGAIVSVKVSDDDGAAAVEATFRQHRYVDPTVRAALYRTNGWNAFDPAATAYTPEQIRQERDRYRR